MLKSTSPTYSEQLINEYQDYKESNECYYPVCLRWQTGICECSPKVIEVVMAYEKEIARIIQIKKAALGLPESSSSEKLSSFQLPVQEYKTPLSVNQEPLQSSVGSPSL